jgi:regulator of cell morphogenesis and NO signaling
MHRSEQTLSQLAREIPGATAVFHRHQLDFCCGGGHSLDINEILAELNALGQAASDETDWAAVPDNQLIEHILTRYHDIHRQQLPELLRLARRVELVHGGDPVCPVGLSAHLEQMHAELEAHMQKEEQILFPMISRGMTGMAVGPVGMMRHEHVSHGEDLSKINKLTHNITLPQGACNTWQALYLGLKTLELDLMNHIHLENNILFHRVDGAREVNHG